MTYVIQFVFAMIATIAFALLFCAPKKELVFCGLSGALGWIVYYIRNPATVYLLCGIFPLVPGAGIYYTAYYLITKESALFSAKGLETFEIALAIVFGIIFGFAIPEAIFHRSRNQK